MIPVVGPFLLLGIVAWVAAIAMGVGSWMGLFRWRERWAVAGGLAGFGTFELYLYASGGLLPLLVPLPSLAFPATAALFVGCGVAAAYGTLFSPDPVSRPRLEAGTAEETLWLHDTLDRLRPARLDWVLTAVLAAPALVIVSGAGGVTAATPLLLTAAAGLAGPLFGAAGLFLRRRATERILAELAEREQLPEGGRA